MQHPNQTNMEDKFGMNFAHFDPESLFNPHMGGLHLGGVKRSAHEAGLDRESIGLSDEDESVKKEDSWPWDPNKDSKSGSKSKEGSKSHSARDPHPQTHLEDPARPPQSRAALPNGKKTKGRVKIKMEFIDNKLRRYTTFSKRKTGIMKKAYELSTLTGTQVMLLVASETGHVYTFATRKLQPMITSEAGKALIQTCLNSPDPPSASGGAVSGSHAAHSDQRMSATGYEETELTYAVADDEHKSPPSGGAEEYFNGSSYSGSDSSSPPTPALSPAHNPNFSFSTPSPVPVTSSGSVTPGINSSAFPVHLAPGLVLTPSDTGSGPDEPESPSPATPIVTMSNQCLETTPNLTPLTILKSPSGGGMVMGSPGGSLMYSPSGGVVYAPNSPLLEGASTPLLLNLPQGLQVTSDQGASANPQLVTLPMNLASAAVAAASAMSSAGVGSTPSNESLPTDLSLHVKRENRS